MPCLAMPGPQRPPANRVRVWDLPTRLFHWALVLLLIGAVATGLRGGNLMALHGRIGLAIVGLLAFRIAWGFAGSTHARFASFVRGPGAIRDTLRGQWRGIGHNPLGALSVLALLGALAFQVGTGLFANDDIAFNGPLYPLAAKATSDWLTTLHKKSFWLLALLVATHLAAIATYVRLRGEDLVKPMLHGWKEVPDGTAEPARGGGFKAFLLSLALALLAVWGASGGFLAAPPPPAPAAAPAW